MAYTKHPWTTREPITQEKMNHIEDGINDAHTGLSARYTKSEIDSIVSDINDDIANAQGTADDALSIANTADGKTAAGNRAWTYVSAAMEIEDGEVTKSLKTRLEEDERTISSATSVATTVFNITEDARQIGTIYDEETGQSGVTASSLAKKIADMDRNIALATATASGTQTIVNDNHMIARLNALDANTDITSAPYSMSVPDIITELKGARGKNKTGGDNTSLDARLDLIDGGGNAPSRTLPEVITEIDGAHRDGVTNDTLDKRLDDIDNVGSSTNQTHLYRITQLETEMSNARSGATDLDARLDGIDTTVSQKVAKSDIKKNLTYSTDDDSVLQARQGKLLKDEIDAINDKIGGSYSSSSTVHSAITGLDERLDAIDGGTALTGNDLATRVSSIESEIDAANGSGTLDDRFDAIEANISTIAGELAMVDGTSIVDTNTRVDTLENDLRTMAAELNMLDGTAIVDTNTRIDTIDADLNTASTGIKARLDAIDNTSTGAIKALQDADDALDGRLDTIEADLNTATTGLKAKVAALEGKDSTYTEVVHSTTYDSNGKPEITSPSENIDYLIKGADPDTKYYYWKYIKVSNDPATYSWELISGAGGGGSGTGNSNAEDYATYSAFAAATKELNKDYYVLQDDGVRHHYRYLENEDEQNPFTLIEIGTVPSNIKRYNIEKLTKGDNTYLRLYEFEYGTGNTITIETDADDWVASTSYVAEDRVLHDGYFYSCITPNSDAEWTPSHWELISDMRAVTTIELPRGGGGAVSGAVTRFIRLAPTSITTIQSNEPIYIHFFYSCVDPSAGSFEGHYVLKDQNGVELDSGDINSGEGTGNITSWPQDKDEGQIYNDGYASINVQPYCVLGKNTFNVTITTTTNETYTRTWSVDIKQLSILSNAPASDVAEVGDTIDLAYTPYGAMQKTLIVKVDGVQVKTETLGAGITGTEQVCTIPAQSVAGAHTISLQLSAQINGETKYSDAIIRDYIWYNPEDDSSIIIASPYRNTQVTTTQYSEVVIPYTIYKANTNSFTVEYYLGSSATGTPFDTVVLNNSNSGEIRYIPTNASVLDNEHSTTSNKVYIPDHITLKVENTTITFDYVATPMEIDIAPVAGAVIDFNPATLNNNSTNRLPSYLSVSDNFNWSSNWEGDNQDSGGGYRTDEDGKCFVIKAGTYADIDYKMFRQHNVNAGDGTTLTTSNVFDAGAEMKIIFKVTDVRDASAIWFTNTGKFAAQDDTEVGIQLSAHEGWLKTDKASNLDDDEIELPAEYQDKVWSKTKAYAIDDIVVYKSIIYKCIKAIAAPAEGEENSWNKKAWQSLGQLETEISATNSYLYFPYSEDDKIELDININQQGNGENFIMSYEDGVPSKAYPYNYNTGGDILYHVLNEESIIRIGSPDCDVHVYRLRIYNTSLSTDQILKNFIADGETIDERIARYDRNAIYYSAELNEGNGGYTPYKTGAAVLDPYRLAERIPNVKVLMLDTPRFTTGKKDFVKNSSLRCIQAEGGKVYPAKLDKDNWYFFNGYHAGQGTTSDNYGQSARNVDFLFECDGTHAPTKIGNLASTDFPDENYKSGLAQGNTASVYDQISKTWSVASGVTPETCTNWMNDTCKVSLTHDAKTGAETSVPNNYFNLKVNVASSENVNNALFQKRYNDYLPYTSPAKNRDSRIKNDMEFVPAVLFVREYDDTNSYLDNKNVRHYPTHKEFDDTEWHFYALGNIGDSKKTDYTRAYDPTDMNEFTIEISDNNTANSQFQSGVFLSDPTDDSTATVETQAMADDPNIDQDPMKYIYPITSEQWNAVDGNGQYINYRHKTLSTEGFDGDHSFEFRYACCGHYRDGDLINPYNEEDPQYAIDIAQGETNRAVWEAFYEWIVTSTKEQFRSEAALWFVPSAIEFFYAFTHYYTMMDNRAKNTFWHFAKTGTRRAVPIGRAVPALMHVYEESDGNGGYQAASGTFDNTKQYYTQYAFDLWTYDCDTACGIDNNGELSFPYGKEDTDYRVTGQPASGWAFNGSGSIFWRRLSAANADGGFEEEISALMRQEDDNCFSTAQHLITQFDEFQNCFPEEIWRLDIERKYIRTFTGKSVDNSITDNKQNIRFLRAMMQGRKKYQRRQWVRNQAIYFGSKYGLNNVRTAEHTIEFNIYTPSSDGVNELAVPVDQSQLVIKPYQDMYIDVAVGNSTTNLSTQDFKRAKAGERVVVDCRSGGSAQETRVYIFGGEHIMALENLAPMYTYSGSFGQGKRLKVLDLGSDNANYNNPRFTSISINENMPLLETFSVKNCNRLAQSINLSMSNNLRVFEADGSLITGVVLPAYSNIETLHLPATVTSLSLNSARALTDFYIKNKTTGEIDYSNLITLNVNDSDYSEDIDWIDIALQTLDEKINYLYLQNLYTASITDISTLDAFDDKKKALEVNYGDDGELIKHIVLSGMLKITGEWSSVERDYYGGLPSSVWPALNFDTTEGTEVQRYKIVYKYDSATNGGAEIYTTYITPAFGSETITIPEIYSNTPGQSSTLSSVPTKPSTKEYYYTFGTIGNTGYYTKYSGWRLTSTGNMLTNGTATISINSIVNNTVTVETIFNSSPMSYPIHWYLNENDVAPAYIAKDTSNNVVTVQYGKNYNGHVPTVQDLVNAGKTLYTLTTSGTNVTYKIFDGWQTTPVNLTLTDEEAANANPAYRIYAKWYSGTKTIAAIRDAVEYSPEKLLLFSQKADLRTNSTYFSTNKRYDIPLGYDGVTGGQQITPFTENGQKYINMFGEDSDVYHTNIRPLTAENNAFTLVLDYQFDTSHIYSNSVYEAVLAGCYESSGSATYGFRLFFDPINTCVRVGFGDTLGNQSAQTKVISDGKASQYRNIIVLRHAQDDPVLYVYSGIRYNSGAGLNAGSNMEIFDNLDADGFVQTINWSNIATNAELIFGGLSDPPISNAQVTNAYGKIFWSKYWNYDVGSAECRMLAAWPHETITFGVQDYNGMTGTRVVPTIQGISQPNIILTGLSTSSYIGPIFKTMYDEPHTTGSLSGWHNSWYREFSNNRIFFGLPTTLQSLVAKTTNVCRQEQWDGSKFTMYNATVNATDYVFFPAYAEIQNASSPFTVEANHTYYWYLDSAATVYAYQSGSTAFSTTGSNSNTKNYMNLRFPYKSLGLTNRIFTNYDGNVAAYGLIPNITRGDVLVLADNIAFIYVDSTDVANGAPVVPNEGRFQCASGGWVRAEQWWLRSIINGEISNLSQHIFMYVYPNGSPCFTTNTKMSNTISNYNSQPDSTLAESAIGACICYSFGV